MKRSRATGWALAVGVGTLALGVAWVDHAVTMEAATRRAAAAHAGRRAGAAIESRVGRALSSTYALAAAVRQHGAVEDFDHLAAEMLQVYGGIASLQLAPGGVVRQIHPLAGNEAAIGHDLLADPERRAEALAAIASRQLTLAGPFRLRQGGVGLVGRYPIFVREAGGERFWGFANALLELDRLLADAGLPHLPGEGLAFELARWEAGTGRRFVIAADGALPPDPERTEIAVANGTWSLAIAPREGWRDGGLALRGLAATVLAALVGAAMAWLLARHPERLRIEVAARTAELRRAYEQLERDAEIRRRAEERLREAEKLEAIGQLAGGVAHDFNNLLTGILGCASAIAAEADRGSPVEDAARTIEQASRRAAELTGQLLGFARRGKLTIAPVDVNAVVRETERLLARTLDARIRLDVRLAAGELVVLGDAGQLQRAVLNLAVNARDAMPEGGTLTLSTARVERDAESLAPHPAASPGPFVALTVGDTGPGIPPAIRARIFEPFFTTKEVGRGTGMGLATVYGVAANHGGFVALESEEGQGARFTLCLPAHAAAGIPAPSAPDAGPDLPTRLRVLVVDDEAVVRDGTVRVLERMGHAVVARSGGAEAVEVLRAAPTSVDLAIVDLGMPGMDGAATFAALRAIEPRLPIVVTSGYALDGRAQELLDAGAAGFLQKPWTPAELAEAVARGLGAEGAAGAMKGP